MPVALGLTPIDSIPAQGLESGDGQIQRGSQRPGVYLLFDLDDRPLYVGKSGTLRSRLEQHFIRQDSSATADGLLDIYDVLRVSVWYADPGRCPGRL